MALSGHSVVMARAWHLYMPVLSPSRDPGMGSGGLLEPWPRLVYKGVAASWL